MGQAFFQCLQIGGVLFGKLRSRTLRVVWMTGHEICVHGQPFGLGEFETHPMLDFRSNELGHLEEELAGKVGDIRVAQDLLQEVLGVLGQFGGTNAPGSLALKRPLPIVFQEFLNGLSLSAAPLEINAKAGPDNHLKNSLVYTLFEE
jgi:hypothetical protein